MEIWLEGTVSHAFATERNRAWLNIETREVFSEPGWPYARRWSVFMVALAIQSGISLTVSVVSGSEGEVISYLRGELSHAEPELVVYEATREFDEMVLRGRFTHARRAHLEEPHPSVPNLDDLALPWHNIHSESNPSTWYRGGDVPSNTVPVLWETDDPICRTLVAIHCARDVAELLLEDPTTYGPGASDPISGSGEGFVSSILGDEFYRMFVVAATEERS